jgi:hypothetical protein
MKGVYLTFFIPWIVFLAIIFWWYGGPKNYLQKRIEKRKKSGERVKQVINSAI